MKIAIIEDRIGRLDQFAEFDIREFKTAIIITGPIFDSLIHCLETKNTEVLDQYDCIASHRSALSSQVRDTIKEYCNKKKKPLIFFSGGINSSVFKDTQHPFLHINSKDFYSLNLKLFLEIFENHNDINLLVLQFGKRWKLTLLLNLRNKIAVSQNKQVLKDMYADFEVEDIEIIKRVRDLEINDLIKNDLINERTEGFLSRDGIVSLSAEQIQEVRFVVDQVINGIV